MPSSEEVINLEVLDVKDRHEYIVALLYENGQEIPVPLGTSTDDSDYCGAYSHSLGLDIAKSGGPCCKVDCVNLKRHLEKLWGSRAVIQARRISEPNNNEDPLLWELNEEYFTPRQNDLFLECVSK
jgi:hypothetical protein